MPTIFSIPAMFRMHEVIGETNKLIQAAGPPDFDKLVLKGVKFRLQGPGELRLPERENVP